MHNSASLTRCCCYLKASTAVYLVSLQLHVEAIMSLDKN